MSFSLKSFYFYILLFSGLGYSFTLWLKCKRERKFYDFFYSFFAEECNFKKLEEIARKLNKERSVLLSEVCSLKNLKSFDSNLSFDPALFHNTMLVIAGSPEKEIFVKIINCPLYSAFEALCTLVKERTDFVVKESSI